MASTDGHHSKLERRRAAAVGYSPAERLVRQQRRADSAGRMTRLEEVLGDQEQLHPPPPP